MEDAHLAIGDLEVAAVSRARSSRNRDGFDFCGATAPGTSTAGTTSTAGGPPDSAAETTLSSLAATESGRTAGPAPSPLTPNLSSTAESKRADHDAAGAQQGAPGSSATTNGGGVSSPATASSSAREIPHDDLSLGKSLDHLEDPEQLRQASAGSHATASSGRGIPINNSTEVDTNVVSQEDHLRHFPGSHSLFAVYDGHGGKQVAEFCRRHVPRLLQSLIHGQALIETEISLAGGSALPGAGGGSAGAEGGPDKVASEGLKSAASTKASSSAGASSSSRAGASPSPPNSSEATEAPGQKRRSWPSLLDHLDYAFLLKQMNTQLDDMLLDPQ